MIEIEDTDHRTLTYMERSITEVRLTSCLDGFDQRSKSVITSKAAESKRVIGTEGQSYSDPFLYK